MQARGPLTHLIVPGSGDVTHPFGFTPAMDEALIVLGRELTVALADERQRTNALPTDLDEEWSALEELCAPSVATMDRIRSTPALTIYGWQIKNQAEAAW